MFKRTDYDNTAGYRKKKCFEDWEFWIQLLDEESQISYIDQIHFYYRDIPNSMSKTESDVESYKQSIWIIIFLLNKAVYLKFSIQVLSE
ncbi:MAG: hypothetical protein IPP60_09645 [Sphingobacteriales bacterium]|nr:hypothetical protein [Sphingobacteriales bacterium]